MKFEHVSFNDKFWKGKPLEQFLKEEGHHGLTVEQLTEAHTLINHVEPTAEESKSEEESEKVATTGTKSALAEEKVSDGPAFDAAEKNAGKKNAAKQNA